MPSIPQTRIALAKICAALGAEDLVPLPAGGSTAEVWRAGAVVIKFLDGTTGRVDGHDLQTFMLKPQQIARIHADLPGLSPYYVQVTGEWHGPSWAAYSMPYIDGRAVSEPLTLQSPDVPRFLTELSSVIRVLTEYGYAARDCQAPAFHFSERYVDRIRRRLPLLRAHLDPAMFAESGIVVNGRRRPPVTALLGQLAERALALQPARLHYPVHGDLNLGNLIVRAGEPGFAVLDPRGTHELWDPIYDMAKILFSLVVYEPAMRGGFTVTRSCGSEGFQVALRQPIPPYYSAAGGFPALLHGLPFFGRLGPLDPDWPRRLVFANAAHCLAEAACRLSDRRPRNLGESRGWAACLELASGLFLTGLVLLDDALQADASGCSLASTHLDSVTEIVSPQADWAVR
jgi:aminoglycoside phosphotransferase (APT) family kinase protein